MSGRPSQKRGQGYQRSILSRVRGNKARTTGCLFQKQHQELAITSWEDVLNHHIRWCPKCNLLIRISGLGEPAKL